MKSPKAFTLAEVLIALAIIGVVAALTIPNFVQSHKKRVVITKLQKIYTQMNQAIRLSEIENGPAKNWDFCNYYEGTNDADTMNKFFEKYLSDYLAYQKTEIVSTEVPEDDATKYSLDIYLNDGSILRINADSCRDFTFLINEKAKLNNKRGVNFFSFRIHDKTTIEGDLNAGEGFEPFAWGWDGTRDGLFHGSSRYSIYGCSDSAKMFCTKLIQYEGWQIPKDYPYKF